MTHCSLCFEDKQLRESHIIPKHLFKFHKIMPRYNKDNALLLIQGDKITETNYNYDGEKEYLLCEECEKHIGVYEDYFTQIFHHDPIPKKHKITIEYTELRKGELGLKTYRGLDYHKTKLYFISVFWRMSISKLPVFRYYKLGAYHEETMRRLILSNDGGHDNLYPISKMSCIDKDYPGGHLSPLQSLYLRQPNGYAWRGLIGNLGITVKISHKGIFEVPEAMEELFNSHKLKQDGSMVEAVLPPETWSKLLYRDAGVGEMLDKHAQYFNDRKKNKIV